MNETGNNILKIFSNMQYQIPIYQRGYAWGGKEIEALLLDIVDAMHDSAREYYYIGTLVTTYMKNSNMFQVIDGQQRLTTLYIILCFLKSENVLENFQFKENCIVFESRESSTKALKYLYENPAGCPAGDIKNAYEIIEKYFKGRYLDLKEFKNFFCNNVLLIKSEVPEDTDLNHYFEIMNSRGEQLEKHEVLKAQCMGVINNEKYKDGFAVVWDAVSDMSRYVQYGFSVSIREKVFGKDWDVFIFRDWESLFSEVGNNKKNEEKDNLVLESFCSVIDYKKKHAGGSNPDNKNEESDSPDRFYSIIDFQNFLLQVLKIYRFEKDGKYLDVKLNDNQLIEGFHNVLGLRENKNDSEQRVCDFCFYLLKSRYLFDKYIIKREYIRDKEQWSLKCIHRTEGRNVSYRSSFSTEDVEKDNKAKPVVMLLSMFHVSNPSMQYKNWLLGALKWLVCDMKDEADITAEAYRCFLEKMATAFLFDYQISIKEYQQSYERIIFQNGCELKATPDTICLSCLDSGTQVDNFVFNYLDYQLWKTYKEDKNKEWFKDDKGRTIQSNLIENFEFTIRTSVEHYYPRNAFVKDCNTEDEKSEKEKLLDGFGNLCLISRNRNSVLSNRLPYEKRKYYRDTLKEIDSIKQEIMFNYGNWEKKEICDHGEKMKVCLLASSKMLQSDITR